MYGFDLSSNSMINRIQLCSPRRHTESGLPEFLTFQNSRTRDMRSRFTSRRGSDYRNAYRLGMSIMGEVFDELIL